MKAIIYARFSPRRHADKCESCDTQLERCRAHCAAAEWKIVKEFRDDALSGSTDDRPGFQKAIRAACSHRAALVVYSLSRFARSTRDAIEYAGMLDRSGAQLVSLHESIDTTTAMGRFTFSLLAALDQLERERIAERTSEAMLSHIARGRKMSSRTPWGWRWDPDNPDRMIPDEEERALVHEVVSLSRKGLGMRRIIHILNGEGKRNRDGRPIGTRTIDCIRRRHRDACAVPWGERLPTEIDWNPDRRK